MQSGNCTHCGKFIQMNLGKAHCLVSYGVSTAVAMSSYVVHGVERDGLRLCGSSTKDSCDITDREGG